MQTTLDRRSFIKRTAAVGGGLIASSAIPPAASAAKAEGRSNILVIIVDQLPGGPVVPSPSPARLATPEHRSDTAGGYLL
jgi:hypothetical protein